METLSPYDESARVFNCLPNDCPSAHFQESNRLGEFLVRNGLRPVDFTTNHDSMMKECKPCHSNCAVCTAFGTAKTMCPTCRHVWFRDSCVKVCPAGES
ncbi:unnamed protein product [Protopolystoma xenopodis]|uniref:Furin-like cysteine-rich domain-containing protein n=1 Tax=Protopolystoma xenopodis TaxID=117903 RepID=A0A3S5CPU3_9PLAT|nr:unnamed protein product [Protopolystoma xenopodis]